MGRRSSQEISVIRDLIKKIMLELKIESPTNIMETLESKYNKKISKPILLRIVSEIKNANLTQEATSNLELEYENHPEIIEVNNRIKTLRNDFDKTESITERYRISSEINSAQETKLKLKKLLKETEVVSERGNKIQYTVYFDGPNVAKKESDENEKNKEAEKNGK